MMTGLCPTQIKLAGLEVVASLPIFAVEQVAHGFAAGGIGAFVGLQGIGSVPFGIGFFVAALGTAVCESRLARFEFEFFAADYAGFDRVGHLESILSR
jgi:hypothetical protein